jgi:DnaJ domain
MNQRTERSPHQLLDVLAEFESRPGRYSLVMHEPHALFDNCRSILMLACGRLPADIVLDGEELKRAQKLAAFFIRTALLRAGVDHYTLLGLRPGYSDSDLRDHYRLFMRLTHPDYSSEGGQWPVDAAGRINRAYETLSSAPRRAQYDRELNDQTQRKAPSLPVRQRTRIAPPVTATLKKTIPRWVWAGATATVVVAMGFMSWAWLDGAQIKAMNATARDVQPDARTLEKKQEVALVALPTEIAQPQATPVVRQEALHSEIDGGDALQAQRPRETAAVLTDRAVAMPVVGRPKPALVSGDAQTVSPSAREVTMGIRETVTPIVRETPQAPKQIVEIQMPPAAAGVPLPATVAVRETEATKPGRLRAADAQPLLTPVLLGMQTGNEEAIVRSLDRSVRNSDGVMELVRAYKFLIGKSRDIQVSAVQLQSRSDADQLVLYGLVELRLQDVGQPAPMRELRIRAVFNRQAGQVTLTQLSTGG